MHYKTNARPVQKRFSEVKGFENIGKMLIAVIGYPA